MGNYLILCRPNYRSSLTAGAAGHEKIVRVAKTDGKILEYRTSILVKDLLVNYAGFGIGISQEASSQHLPQNYELKIGQIYYLLPSYDSVTPSTTTTDCTGGVKRIKVIITKKQLQELLSKKASLEEVLSGIQKGTWDDGVDSSRSWSPKLETIPEGSE